MDTLPPLNTRKQPFDKIVKNNLVKLAILILMRPFQRKFRQFSIELELSFSGIEYFNLNAEFQYEYARFYFACKIMDINIVLALLYQC